MLVTGYCFGIRSERSLCEEVHLNVAYRWFCRLDLEQRVPDHSTFSKNRHGRFRQSDAFRHVFESVLRRSRKEGLVAGEGFAIDASVIKADASRASRWTEGEAPTRAVREYLQALEPRIPGRTTNRQKGRRAVHPDTSRPPILKLDGQRRQVGLPSTRTPPTT